MIHTWWDQVKTVLSLSILIKPIPLINLVFLFQINCVVCPGCLNIGVWCLTRLIMYYISTCRKSIIRLSMSLKHVRTYLSPRVCCAIKIPKYPTPMHRRCIHMAKLIEVVLLLASVFAPHPYRSPSGRQGRQDSVSLLTPPIFLVSLSNVTRTLLYSEEFDYGSSAS